MPSSSQQLTLGGHAVVEVVKVVVKVEERAHMQVLVACTHSATLLLRFGVERLGGLMLFISFLLSTIYFA